MSTATMTEVVVKVRDVLRAMDFYGRVLGLPVGRQEESWGQLNAGSAVITLQKDSPDLAYERTANLTFLVPDLPGRCEELERLGVRFTEQFNYEVGQIADFTDVDGHWLSLYQPSALAMTWPGADKLREAAATAHRTPLVYVFIFVGDADVAANYYGRTLGLPVVDSRACRRGSTMHEKGVVKYDAGPVLLTTHHAHGCPASVRTGADGETATGGSGVMPVLAVLAAGGQLHQKEVVTDPFGHLLLLRQLETASNTVHD